MTGHVVELLHDYTLGALDAATERTVERHLADCVDCADALAGIFEVQALLALQLEPVQPDPSVRRRVLESVAPGRLRRFAGHVGSMFGIDERHAAELLDRMDEPGMWETSEMPGVVQWIVPGAPPNHLMGFIRVPAGGQVPWHEHLGREQTLVLEGRLVDNDGVVYLPGEAMPKVVGTRHTFFATEEIELVCAVIIQNGWTLL